MNIYEELDYRTIFKKIVSERKKLDRAINFENLARHLRIEKSYLSKILNGKADFNKDQLYLACEYIRLNEKQRAYLDLLLEYDRSSLQIRRSSLRIKIEKAQRQSRETKEHLKALPVTQTDFGMAEYYFDPVIQIVHICLCIERYQKNPLKLATDLELSPSQLSAAINKLEELKIISRNEKEIRILRDEIHLPRESAVYPGWQKLLKLLSIQRTDRASKTETYNFSVIFNANPPTRNMIHARFLDFLKEVEQLARPAPKDETYQMNFDLFCWTR